MVVRFVVKTAKGEPAPYLTEDEARREAKRAAERFGWADYYRVAGEPATDIWRCPELLGGYEADRRSDGDAAKFA
jgi:hypothetical protein